jgi:Clp amino terminal domain, pathogenicity island component
MIVQASAFSDPRQANLMKELAAVGNSLSDFREALRPVNDEVLNDAFRELLDSAERIVEEHARRPSQYIADDIAKLRSLLAGPDIPREDPDLGRLPSLTALRSARGSLLADFDSILDEARGLGLVPRDPKSYMPEDAVIQRAGREGQLAALQQRLQRVERLLETKIAPEGQPDGDRSLQQIGLVKHYLATVKIELILAMLETKTRDLINLTGLWRTVEAIGELTADFVATVQGLREKTTNSLKRATQMLRPSVRRLVRGLGTMVAPRRRQSGPAAPPEPTEPATPPEPTGVVFSRSLEQTLHRSLAYANEHHHEYATLEHLLLALVDDEDAASVMRACNVDLDKLRRDLLAYIESELENLVTDGGEDSKATADFQRVVQRAVIHVQSAGLKEVTGANALVAIFAEGESHAAYFLQEQGITRYDAVNYLSHGVVKNAPG